MVTDTDIHALLTKACAENNLELATACILALEYDDDAARTWCRARILCDRVMSELAQEEG